MLNRLLLLLTYARVIIGAGAVLGLLAGVMMMVAEGAPVFCREMGALFLVATALFTAISVLQFRVEFYLRKSVASQENIIESQSRIIESQKQSIDILRKGLPW